MKSPALMLALFLSLGETIQEEQNRGITSSLSKRAIE